MGDMGEVFAEWNDYKKEMRQKFGVECAECKRLFPKAHPKILLPDQTCRRHGWTAPSNPEFDKEKANLA